MAHLGCFDLIGKNPEKMAEQNNEAETNTCIENV